MPQGSLAAVVVVVGVHLVEHYLSLTTSWDKLVKAFPSLYNDLTTTPPERLMDLSSPAFSFISKERFNESTIQVLQQYKGRACSTLKLLLPMLACGWDLVKQKLRKSTKL